MASGMTTVIFPVKDLARAKVLYRKLLGTEPYADQPYYVGFKVAGQDIGLDPNGHSKGMTMPVAYMEVDDIKATLQQVLDAGAQIVQSINDVGGGKLIAIVKDVDGNLVGLMHTP
jgi:predicted enzyme related to lactoylglutathione lyase